MLTKDDLQQLQILIESSENRIKNEFDKQLEPITNDLFSLRNETQSGLKTIKKNVSHIKKTVDLMGRVFDREDMNIQKRVDRIENHLNLSPAN